jgi:hypothetical protein
MKNETVWSRLGQMFSARQTGSDDPLRELLFSKTVSFVESTEYANTDWNTIRNGAVLKDFLSDAYTYITRDRPLAIDQTIEQELLQDEEPRDQTVLEYDDVHNMQIILNCRKLLF